MTKLEEKLIELGDINLEDITFIKPINKTTQIIIYIEKDYIIDYKVHPTFNCIKYQFHIDRIQQAFDEMQKDLEALKKYEN